MVKLAKRIKAVELRNKMFVIAVAGAFFPTNVTVSDVMDEVVDLTKASILAMNKPSMSLTVEFTGYVKPLTYHDARLGHTGGKIEPRESVGYLLEVSPEGTKQEFANSFISKLEQVLSDRFLLNDGSPYIINYSESGLLADVKSLINMSNMHEPSFSVSFSSEDVAKRFQKLDFFQQNMALTIAYNAAVCSHLDVLTQNQAILPGNTGDYGFYIDADSKTGEATGVFIDMPCATNF